MELVTKSIVDQAHAVVPYTAAAYPLVEKGKGERVLSATMMPSTPYGFPAVWGYNRWRQVTLAYRGWYYLGTRCRCEEISSHRPLAGFVSQGGDKSTRTKFLRTYGRKSDHAARPHEVIEPLGPDHPLERLFDRPNEWDHAGIGDILDEAEMFLCLTGNAYIMLFFNDRTGMPEELYVIPSQWVFGPFLDPKQENGVSYYEIRPLIGTGVLKVPYDHIIHIQEKGPIHKLVGWAPTQAISEWIDSLDSVMTARFFMMKNGAFPAGAIELGAQYHDPDDEEMDRIRAKFFNRIQGETKYGTPLVLPPGAKYMPLVINPSEMAFIESADQLRDWILASLGVPKEIAGLQDAGTEIAMYGPLRQFCRKIKFRQSKIAAVLTRCLASRYDPSIRVWFEDPTPDSPEERRAKWTFLVEHGLATFNEARAEYGLEPYAQGGDDPYLPTGATITPLNSGEDLSWMDELMPTPAGKGEKDKPGGDDAEEESTQPGKDGDDKEGGKEKPPEKEERKEDKAAPVNRVRELVTSNGVHKNGWTAPAAPLVVPEPVAKAEAAPVAVAEPVVAPAPVTKSYPDTLIELPDIRQEDDYSCCAACCMAVGRYFGVGPETLEEWKTALGTSEKSSTLPPVMEEYLASLGLTVTPRQNMTVDDLAECWKQGVPVICFVQEYGEASKQASFNYGHCVVVIGVALGKVFVFDPSIDNAFQRPGGSQGDVTDPDELQSPGESFIDIDTWNRVWHDEDVLTNKYESYGIAVSNGQTAKTVPIAASHNFPARRRTNEGQTEKRLASIEDALTKLAEKVAAPPIASPVEVKPPEPDPRIDRIEEAIVKLTERMAAPPTIPIPPPQPIEVKNVMPQPPELPWVTKKVVVRDEKDLIHHTIEIPIRRIDEPISLIEQEEDKP